MDFEASVPARPFAGRRRESWLAGLGGGKQDRWTGPRRTGGGPSVSGGSEPHWLGRLLPASRAGAFRASEQTPGGQSRPPAWLPGLSRLVWQCLWQHPTAEPRASWVRCWEHGRQGSGAALSHVEPTRVCAQTVTDKARGGAGGEALTQRPVRWVNRRVPAAAHRPLPAGLPP